MNILQWKTTWLTTDGRMKPRMNRRTRLSSPAMMILKLTTAGGRDMVPTGRALKVAGPCLLTASGTCFR
jgi:hypothetical protein